jgi:hypothetical protein
MPAEQPSRFGKWNSEIGLWQLGDYPAKSETLFAGQRVHERMKKVRPAISDIRLHWDLYPQFMDELRTFLSMVKEPPVPSLEYATAGRMQVEALLASRKEWPELGSGAEDDYSAIRLYTSPYGYDRMFGAMNEAFRATDIDRYPQALRAVTFLVELLNIDLYRYIHSNPEAAGDFQGRVYRGLRVSDDGLAKFAETAADADMEKRYMAIPLFMTSTSATRSKALGFARRTSKTPAGSHALLLDISVYNMGSELISAYRQAFPASIVTSLCSVPIHPLSALPEDEVLLRGPFFQIVHMYCDQDSLVGEPLHVVQMVMLNSNRDHVTAVATNTGADLRMRDIFRLMALASRSTRCAEHAESSGLAADSDYYRKAASRAYAEFSTLM